jgi:hypothetical protein
MSNLRQQANGHGNKTGFGTIRLRYYMGLIPGITRRNSAPVQSDAVFDGVCELLGNIQLYDIDYAAGTSPCTRSPSIKQRHDDASNLDRKLDRARENAMAGNRFLNPLLKVGLCSLGMIVMACFLYPSMKDGAEYDYLTIGRVLVFLGFTYLLVQSLRQVLRRTGK